ncbi:hypothetical protein RFI_00155, partial [Reticulomyxa filosa]
MLKKVQPINDLLKFFSSLQSVTDLEHAIIIRSPSRQVKRVSWSDLEERNTSRELRRLLESKAMVEVAMGAKVVSFGKLLQMTLTNLWTNDSAMKHEKNDGLYQSFGAFINLCNDKSSKLRHVVICNLYEYDKESIQLLYKFAKNEVIRLQSNMQMIVNANSNTSSDENENKQRHKKNKNGDSFYYELKPMDLRYFRYYLTSIKLLITFEAMTKEELISQCFYKKDWKDIAFSISKLFQSRLIVDIPPSFKQQQSNVEYDTDQNRLELCKKLKELNAKAQMTTNALKGFLISWIRLLIYLNPKQGSPCDMFENDGNHQLIDQLIYGLITSVRYDEGSQNMIQYLCNLDIIRKDISFVQEVEKSLKESIFWKNKRQLNE